MKIATTYEHRTTSTYVQKYYPYQSFTSACSISREGFLWFNRFPNIFKNKVHFLTYQKILRPLSHVKSCTFIYLIESGIAYTWIPRLLPITFWIHSPRNRFPWFRFVCLFIFLFCFVFTSRNILFKKKKMIDRESIINPFVLISS